MSDANTASGGGIGVCGILTIVFVVLKLCGVIHWSWWWVLAPTWIPIVLALITLAVVFVAAADWRSR